VYALIDVSLCVCTDHYDIFIVTSDDDQENANTLVDVLVKFCQCCCNYALTVHPELEIGGNKLEHLRSGLEHSTYRFIFIDDGFQLDDLVKFGTDAALMEMINRRDQSIIPVRAHEKIIIPSLLRMFRCLNVHKLLYGKRLEHIDVNSLTETDIDRALLASIVKMVSKSVASGASRQLTGEQSPRPSTQHSEILRRHYSELVNNLDPDSGLLSDLFTANVISSREMESIRTEKTFYDRNEYLIKLLSRKSEKDFMKFVEVLDKEQSHVVDILRSSLRSEKQSVVR